MLGPREQQRMSDVEHTFDTEGSSSMPHATISAGAALRIDSPAPSPDPGLRVRVAPAGPALWRVLDATGRIIGHLHELEHALGSRWAARRYRDGVGGFRTVGEFWSVDDAIGALRNC